MKWLIFASHWKGSPWPSRVCLESAVSIGTAGASLRANIFTKIYHLEKWKRHHLVDRSASPLLSINIPLSATSRERHSSFIASLELAKNILFVFQFATSSAYSGLKPCQSYFQGFMSLLWCFFLKLWDHHIFLSFSFSIQFESAVWLCFTVSGISFLCYYLFQNEEVISNLHFYHIYSTN